MAIKVGCPSRAAVKGGPKTREMGASAGISVGETGAPAESAAASGDGRAGGDYVVHEIHGQELHGAVRADYGVLLHRQTEKTAHTA
jgi:hypothetical protein